MRLCEVWVKSGGMQKHQGGIGDGHGKDGSWQLAVGSWQLAVGSWQLAVGCWQCEKWREVRLKTRNHRLDVGTISAA